MGSTSFEVFVNAQLSVLQDRLIAEHRHHVSRLQNQVVDLKAENSVLFRSANLSPRGSGPNVASFKGDEVRETGYSADESDGVPDSSQPGTISKEADASKKPQELLPGTVQEEMLPESLGASETSKDSSLPDTRGPHSAWGTKVEAVLPPIGQQLEPNRETDEPPAQPQSKTIEERGKQLFAAKPVPEISQENASSEPERGSFSGFKPANIASHGVARLSIASQSGRTQRPSQMGGIMGRKLSDGSSTSEANGQSHLSTKGFGMGDRKRISFQSDQMFSEAEDSGESGDGSRNNRSVVAPLEIFQNAQDAKRNGGGLSAGIDRLSPLKRASAVESDMSGVRRGSNLAGGGANSNGPIRRQSLGIANGRRQSLGGRRQSNNLSAPQGASDLARSSVVSMFGHLGGSSMTSSSSGSSDGDLPLGNGGAFRPSRQRISVTGDGARMSRLRSEPAEAEGGIQRFEVAQAWALGRFGNSLRRSSMGGAARMSQFMDHFLDKDEREQEEIERRDGSTKQCNRLLQRIVIHPNSGKHVSWDFFGLILIAHDAVMVPLLIFDPPSTTFSDTMDWVIRLFWTMNILVTFFTGILTDDGIVEMRLGHIARHYILGWLALDVCVSVFDWLDLVAQGIAGDGLQRFGASWLRALRMVRSARLIRLLRAPEIAKKITELIPFHEWLGLFATVVKIMLIFLWIAHAVACLWFGVGSYMCDHGQCWVDAGKWERSSWGLQYAVSLHWSLSSLSGETSVDPENVFERIYAMCILYLAFVISASYVGSITTTMTNIHMMASEQSAKLNILRRFLLDHGISRTLAVRVQRNAQHAMIEHKSRAPESSVELLGMISQPLMVEVHYEIYSRSLMVHPFFFCYERVNPAGIRKICHTAITMLSLHTKDVLFSDMEVAEKPRTFFLVSGKLQYMHDMKVSSVYETQWMCEHALWTTWTHCGTVRATMETRLLCLDAEKWQDTVCVFPTDHACVYAAEFVNWLNADLERARTDMGPPEADIASMLLQAFPADDEEEIEDEEDEDEGVVHRTGSFRAVVDAIPGLNVLATVMDSPSPHASARMVSQSASPAPTNRPQTSVFAGIITLISSPLLATPEKKENSLHKSRAAEAHHLAEEMKKKCQKRSSLSSNEKDKGAAVVHITALPVAADYPLTRFARCRHFVSRCCTKLFGGDLERSEQSPRTSTQDDADADGRSNESAGERRGSKGSGAQDP